MNNLLRSRLSRRNFLRAGLFSISGSMFAGVLDLKIEPFHLTTEQVAIPLPNLPHAFDGYRIVQLTDIHVGPTIARETISRALTLTHDLAPDMIVITGDFITYRLDEAELSDTLSGRRAPRSEPGGRYGAGKH
jgi:predicted MPP superfamily phosphohydrolase